MYVVGDISKLILEVGEFNFGGIKHQKVLDSLDLFAKEVMPNFTD